MLRRIAAVIIALAMLSACTPSKQYEGSKSEGVFFAVPNDWKKIDSKALAKEESKSSDQNDIDRLAMVGYQVGLSKMKNLSARDVFMLQPTDQPVLYVRIRDLFTEERNAISLNTLRNIILPVTEYMDGSRANDRNFQLIDDQEVVEKGGRGVLLEYSFDYEGTSETVKQAALYSNDHNKIYLFILRCSTKCFNKNVKTVDEIVTSFTVRGAK